MKAKIYEMIIISEKSYFEIGMKHIGIYINHGNQRERYQAEATLNTTTIFVS